MRSLGVRLAEKPDYSLENSLDRCAGGDRIFGGGCLLLAKLFLFLEGTYARTTGQVSMREPASDFCEEACSARAFRLWLHPAISVTLHPARLHVATVMRGSPGMGMA